jgi:hypothetical protein
MHAVETLSSRFIDGVRLSFQDPFRSSIAYAENLGSLLSQDELAFVTRSFLGEDGTGDHRVAFVREEPFDETEFVLYNELPDESKLGVLAFDTVLLHEVTHQIDTTITPFAGLLHMLQVEEFLRLTPVLVALAADPDLNVSAPLVRSARVEGHPVRERLRAFGQLESFEELLAMSSQVRALDGIASADVTPGWCGQTHSHTFLGEEMERVTLFGEVLTLRPYGATRPVNLRTVLETRALSNCLRRILWRFRDDLSLAAREMLRYLDWFYPAEADEYRAIVDAVAKFFGYRDLHSTIVGQARESVMAVDQPLVVASLVCWASLHSSDITDKLIMAARFLQDVRSNQWQYPGPSALLNGFDEQTWQPRRAHETLATALELVQEQRKRASQAPDPLAHHFHHVLSTAERRLTARIDQNLGLGDPMGTPNYGHPALYMSLEQADDLSGSYRPSPAFDQWRRLRTLVLHRRRPSHEKRAAISRWFRDSSQGGVWAPT